MVQIVYHKVEAAKVRVNGSSSTSRIVTLGPNQSQLLRAISLKMGEMIVSGMEIWQMENRSVNYYYFYFIKRKMKVLVQNLRGVIAKRYVLIIIIIIFF